MTNQFQLLPGCDSRDRKDIGSLEINSPTLCQLHWAHRVLTHAAKHIWKQIKEQPTFGLRDLRNAYQLVTEFADRVATERDSNV